MPNEWDYEGIISPLPFVPLDEELEQRIREDWLIYIESEHPGRFSDLTVDEIKIRHFNVYQNGVALTIGPPIFGGAAAAPQSWAIGDYVLFFPSRGGALTGLFFYSTLSSTFMDFVVAYDEGLFARGETRDLAWRWRFEDELYPQW